MFSVPLPDNETERQAALKSYQIMDTATEQDFDDLTELASVICGTPIAIIGFLDEKRHWFKSRKGTSLTESDKAVSFCAHTIAANELIVVEDAHKDLRFANNPAVDGSMNLTFYAGVPLVNQEGYALGTLCVFDQQPKQLTDAQKSALKTLGKQVIDKLELRKKLMELEAANQQVEQLNRQLSDNEWRLNQLIMTAPMGMTILRGYDFVIEIANQPMLDIWSRRREQVMGNRLIDVFPDVIGQPFPKMLANVLTTGEPLSVPEISVDIADVQGINRRLIITLTYYPLLGVDGKPEAIMATVNDITKEIQARRQLEQKEQEAQQLNEELKVANEELQATHEEVQATNEELSAVNEEYVSQNEELASINDELKAAYQDVDDKNRKLYLSEQRLESFIINAPVGICVLTGRAMVIEYANTKILDIWAKTNAIIGTPLHIAMAELQGQPYMQWLDDVFTTGKAFHASESKATLPHLQDKAHYFNFVFQPVFDGKGLVSNVMVVVTDVSSQVSARASIAQALEQLKLTVDAASMGVGNMNITTGEVDLDKRCREIYGLPLEEELSITDVFNTFNPQYLPMAQEALDYAIRYQAPLDIQYEIVSPANNERRWLRTVGKLNVDSEGGDQWFNGVVQDITRQKQEEQQKDDFISIASHELKTPITSLKASLQLLDRMKDNPSKEMMPRLIMQARKSVERVGTLIEDLLNVGRLKQSEIHLNKTTFILSQLLNSCCNPISILHKYKIEIVGDLELQLHADEHRIDQVITNLVNNAVKYAPDSKEIKLSIEQQDHMVKVSVTDYGQGIPASKMPHLFDRYFRVDPTSHQVSGLGLGLYICSEIIQRHGGQMGAESELGKGSTFWFTLPIA